MGGRDLGPDHHDERTGVAPNTPAQRGTSTVSLIFWMATRAPHAIAVAVPNHDTVETEGGIHAPSNHCPAAALAATTSHGGTLHCSRSPKARSAATTSRGPRTLSVKTGL